MPRRSERRGAITAYKFRAPEPFERIREIISTGRLYCAVFTELNDPSEGHYFLDDTTDQYARAAFVMLEAKLRLRVCSLSRSYTSPLLWAHYAKGFEGVAIEVEISNAFPVKYSRRLPEVKFASGGPTRDEAMRRAQRILSHKLKCWESENELRVLSTSKFVNAKIKSVIVGPRFSDQNIASLRQVCSHRKIPIKLAKVVAGEVQVGRPLTRSQIAKRVELWRWQKRRSKRRTR